MNWKPGDRAVYWGRDSFYHGTIVTVTSMPMIFYDGLPYVKTDPDLDTDVGVYCHSLRPIDDDYDGHQVTTWDRCVWQPAVTV